jgi:hypothetical protein
MSGRIVPTHVAGRWVVLGVSVALTVTTVATFLLGNPTVSLAVLAVLGAAFAAYVATVHPLAVFVSLAVVLGAAPFMHVPLSTVPALLFLAVGVWVALGFLPGVEFRPGWCEVWVTLLTATAFLSVVGTGVSRTALVEFVAWVAATALVIPVRFLPTQARITMMRVFAVSASVGAALGVLVRLGPFDLLLDLLSLVGYDPDQNVQRVYGSEEATTRLSGSFLEPNVAGLILAGGLFIAIAYFDRSARFVLVAVIGSGLLLTLSRAAVLTVVLAGLLVLLRAHAHRLGILVSGCFAVLAALAMPSVRLRLEESFGPTDAGVADRLLALQSFPATMDGHWVWGLGWERAEFRSRSLGQVVNYVANGPLVTIYRGGIVVGVLVLLVAAVLVVRSWLAAQRSFEDAVVCCGVIAFILVAWQLDFPIALQAPATAVFSLLVAASLTHAPDPPSGSIRTTRA